MKVLLDKLILHKVLDLAANAIHTKHSVSEVFNFLNEVKNSAVDHDDCANAKEAKNAEV